MATVEDLERRLAELERWREGEQRLLLQAIQLTQSDHTRALVNLEREVGSLRLELGAFRQEVSAGFETLTGMLTQLIERQDGS